MHLIRCWDLIIVQNQDYISSYGSLLAEVNKANEAVQVLQDAVRRFPDEGFEKYMWAAASTFTLYDEELLDQSCNVRMLRWWCKGLHNCRYLGQLLEGEAAIESLKKGLSILQTKHHAEVSLCHQEGVISEATAWNVPIDIHGLWRSHMQGKCIYGCFRCMLRSAYHGCKNTSPILHHSRPERCQE